MNDNRDENQPETTEETTGAQNQGAPEPPARYVPDEQPFEVTGMGNAGEMPAMSAPSLEFAHALKLARIAQIMALVSLVIGGVLLATAAVVVAVISYRRSSTLIDGSNFRMDTLALQALKRTAVIAIVMGVLALGVNAIALAMIYPTMMEMLQTGDYATLFGDMQTDGASSAGTSGSFWG